MNYILNKMVKNGIVAVIRGADEDQIIPIAEALKNGGVKTLEITAETPKVCKLIERVSDEFGDELIIGAGTILDAETARSAIMSGAQFIFSPTVDVDTIRLTKRYGLVSIPGALTPTEILTAYEHGADILKVFPASVFGPDYIKHIHGPMPHIPLMPTGGVNLQNLEDYLKAGSVAVGIGSALVNTRKLIDSNSFVELEQKARQFMEVFHQVNNEFS
ncbi:MAG: bifunctional 4-hydroxy-2-oxoglutarate aldolase/2-dehydro-3-deoxy-phosphogluconate aldolase [Bacillaceae bacterium]|nr:bifunctional 4-hydroxy-2-oxoglutarate aldolase/2-dehydro-3-deoxy-phosphogluconate aldolase [Bacillaceae bacterium]